MTEIADTLTSAARATMVGCAEVALDAAVDIPDLKGSMRLRGRVDFASGRCILEGDSGQLIPLGPDSYEQRDGQWVISTGDRGTQATYNPSWLLSFFAQPGAVIRASEAPGGEIEGELDFDLADRTAAVGIAPDYRLRFRARLLEGRVRTMLLEHIDAASGDVCISETFELGPKHEIEPIELPPPPSLMSAVEHTERQLARWRP